MKITALILLALLSPSENPPTVTSEPECPTTDNLCNAQRFERQAKRSTTPQLRAGRFHGAYLSYINVFDETGKTEHLCAARRAFDRSLEIKGMSPQQRAGIEAERRDLESRERSSGAQCKKPVKRSTNEAPTLANFVPSAGATQPSPPAAPRPVIPPDDATARSVDPPMIDSDTPAARVETRPDPPVLLPVVARRPPTVPDRDLEPRARPGRPLVIIGGLTLVGGLALAGVAGYTGDRMLKVRRDAHVLGGMVDDFASGEQLAQDDALTREYERLGPQTLALALASGATVVIAAVLLGVGGRRMARVASRTAVTPSPGGLAFLARF